MTLPPVVVDVEVALPPAGAFDLFVDGFGGWWPLATYSCFEADAVDVRFPRGVGGVITEVSSAGEEAPWGTVLAFESAARLAFTWHPGGDPDRATEVEVRFAPSAAGTTVRLTHTGWDRVGDQAEPARQTYASGWPGVLAGYADVAAPHPLAVTQRPASA